jgi:hypothetical protein
MFGSERDSLDVRDGVLLALFAALGGALAWLVVVSAKSLFFYQMFTPEALMWACGHGFRHPLPPSPEMVDFLLHRNVPSFDCALIVPDAPTGPPGFFFLSELYLSWVVAALWRLLGPTQMAIAPLAVLLGAGYATGAYALARLFLGRVLAIVAGLALALSPVAIGLILSLRDFSKGPFFLWGIALLVLTARAPTARRGLPLAVATGVIVGVGYGFRADVGILLPIGLAFQLLVSRLRWWAHAAVLTGYAAGFLLLAAPILALGNGGNVGSLVMQGATEPFRAFLGLRPALYALGQTYSDELTLSSIAASERPRHPDWDAREPPPIYGVSQAYTYSLSNLLEWARNFVADFAAQALKGAAWILGYPALVAVTRGHPAIGIQLRVDLGLVRWQEPVYALFGHPWMPMVGLLGVLAWLLRVAARSGREAWGLAALLLAVASYPAIQFSVRHVFHLEFIWVVATLSLLITLWERGRLRAVLPRFSLATAAVFVSLALAYAGLAEVQQRRLTSAFSALLGSPRESVAAKREPQPDGTELFRVPVPPSEAPLLAGPPDSMTDRIAEVGIQNDVRAGAERMLLTLGGTACPDDLVALGLHYDHYPHIWQPLDSTLMVRPGDTVIFPAFYRATQSFAGILLPASHAGCTLRLARLPMRRDLPVVLTAVLPPDWQSRPLRKGFGRFDVGPAH